MLAGEYNDRESVNFEAAVFAVDDVGFGSLLGGVVRGVVGVFVGTFETVDVELDDVGEQILPLLLEFFGELGLLRNLVLDFFPLVAELLVEEVVAVGGDDLEDFLLGDAELILRGERTTCCSLTLRLLNFCPSMNLISSSMILRSLSLGRRLILSLPKVFSFRMPTDFFLRSCRSSNIS
jgi:hypothetical protein